MPARSFAIGDTVRFRPDFGAVGASRLVFTVDMLGGTDAATGRAMVGLTIRTGKTKRRAHRLAYLDDLIAAPGEPSDLPTRR